VSRCGSDGEGPLASMCRGYLGTVGLKRGGADISRAKYVSGELSWFFGICGCDF
jgi:hypothetical protein